MRYLCLLVFMMVLGCAPKSTVISEAPVVNMTSDSEVVSYEKDSEILKNIHKKASKACGESLGSKECTVLDYLYQATRTVFISKGELAKLMILEPSEKHTQDYQNACIEYDQLLSQLRANMLKYNIKE